MEKKRSMWIVVGCLQKRKWVGIVSYVQNLVEKWWLMWNNDWKKQKEGCIQVYCSPFQCKWVYQILKKLNRKSEQAKEKIEKVVARYCWWVPQKGRVKKFKQQKTMNEAVLSMWWKKGWLARIKRNTEKYWIVLMKASFMSFYSLRPLISLA